MRLFLLTLSLIISTLANSQTIGSISLGGNAVNGNYRAFGFNTKLDLKKTVGKYELASAATYRWSKQSKYGTTDLIQYEDESYLNANISMKLNRVRFIGFTENERSYMRSIDLRSSIGCGIGYSILTDSVFDILISEIILPEYYWSREDDSYNNSTLRASTRLKFEMDRGPIKVLSVTLFQPAVFSTRKVTFSENLNVRWSNSVDFKVTKRILVGVLHSLSYEGYPYYINKAVQPLQQTASIVLKCTF